MAVIPPLPSTVEIVNEASLAAVAPPKCVPKIVICSVPTNPDPAATTVAV